MDPTVMRVLYVLVSILSAAFPGISPTSSSCS